MVEVFKAQKNVAEEHLAVPLHCSKQTEQASPIHTLRSSTCWLPLPASTEHYLQSTYIHVEVGIGKKDRKNQTTTEMTRFSSVRGERRARSFNRFWVLSCWSDSMMSGHIGSNRTLSCTTRNESNTNYHLYDLIKLNLIPGHQIDLNVSALYLSPWPRVESSSISLLATYVEDLHRLEGQYPVLCYQRQ